MKRLAITATVLAGLAVFAVGTTEAADWSRGYGYGYSGYGRHSRLHDNLEHRSYHRDRDHRRAHRYPMTRRGHEGLHDGLEHDAYHGNLRHRQFHRSRSGRSFYFGGRRFGIRIGR